MALASCLTLPMSSAGHAAPSGDPAPERDPGARLLDASDLGELRWRVGGRRLRVYQGGTGFEIRRPRLDAYGIGFDTADARSLPGGDLQSLPASPLAWSRIERVEVRKPSGIRGALIGAVVVPAAFVAAVAATGHWQEFTDPSSDGHTVRGLIVTGGIVIGIPLGALAGSFLPHTERVWPLPPSPPVMW